MCMPDSPRCYTGPVKVTESAAEGDLEEFEVGSSIDWVDLNGKDAHQLLSLILQLACLLPQTYAIKIIGVGLRRAKGSLMGSFTYISLAIKLFSHHNIHHILHWCSYRQYQDGR